MRVLGDLSRLQARRRPGKAALLMGDRQLSYRALDSESNAIAHLIAERDIQPGDRVAVLGENSMEYALITQAAAKAGSILLPLNFRLSARELAYVIGNAEPGLIFVESGYLETLMQALGQCGLTPELVTFEHTASGTGLTSILAGTSREAPAIEVDPHSPAIMMYTSGTTGFPKGVLYSHSNYHTLFDGLLVEGDYSPSDIVHLALPMFHNAGLNGALNTTLLIGGTVVIHRGNFDAETVMRDVQRHRINVGLWVPTNLAILLDHPRFADFDLSSMQRIFYGGMSIGTELRARAEAAFDVDFYQVYGSTECGNITILGPLDHRRKPGATGREFYNVEMKIVDDVGADVAAGGVGEVLLKARDCGMSGYWRNPEATSATIRDGWIHSGDVARIDEDGFITIVDRKKDIIISGAENIYPAEVEAVLVQHPKIKEVAVFGIADPKFGETVCAAVVLRQGEAASVEEIDAFCLQHLARYKRPRRIDFIAVLPRNVAGKVLKHELVNSTEQMASR